MEKSQNKFESSCNVDYSEDESISGKIQRLNLRIMQPKCLSYLLTRKLEKSQPSENYSGRKKQEEVEKSPKRKISKLKRTSAPRMMQKISLQMARFQQIIQIQGQRQVLRKQRNISELHSFSGKAKIILQDDTIYEGECTLGSLFDDVKITYKNGEIYFGSTHHYKKHGKGNLFFPSGQKYVGYFSYDQYHGQGTFYDRQGNITLTGMWNKGKIQLQQTSQVLLQH